MTLSELENAVETTRQEIAKLNKQKVEIEKKLNQYHNKLTKLIKKINEEEDKCYYVYVVFVEGEPKYAGKGSGERYKHAVGGTSSVAELNRDFFSNKKIEVGILFGNITMSEEEAIEYERNVIGSLYSDHDIYNKTLPKEDSYTYMDCNFKEYCSIITSNKE